MYEGSWKRSISQCFPGSLEERSNEMECNFNLLERIYAELRYIRAGVLTAQAKSTTGVSGVGGGFAYL